VATKWCIPPGVVYKRVIQYNTTPIIARREATFCYCNEATGEVDCFRDNFISIPIYPGQLIPINLIQVPTAEITAAAAYLWRDILPYQLLNWKSLVNKKCMPLPYRVLTTSREPCFAGFTARGILTKSTFHCYYISFKQNCPPGFELHNGVCDCNKHLTAAFPSLTCDIHRETINRPAYIWIAYSKKGIIQYVKKC